VASWWKGNIGSGLAIGIGSLIIAPLVIPALSKTTRPLVKAAIKGGLVLWGTGKEKLSEAYEVVEDLLAEAKSEIASETAHGADVEKLK
jgi:hypothetical protein